MNTGHSTDGETDGGIVERVVGEQLYDALFEDGNRVAMLLEPDGRVVDANAPALALGGFDRDDVVGEPVWATPLFAGTASRAVRADVRCAAAGFPASGDREVDTEDGVVVLDVILQPIAPAEDEVAFLLLTGVDVTDRERRIAALGRRVERLEEFARVVSHDLRTPLSVASANLELAAERADLPELGRADRALDRIDALFEDIQSVASRGYTVEERTRVGLGTVARAAWAHVDTGDATLAVESTTHLLADETQLMQVFENLFENAVEHGSTPSASPSSALTVRVGATEDGFYVADDGCGLPENAFGSVFEAGVTTTSDGTGFGLSIVESIIQAHGWAIEAGESADGGARFDVLTDPEDPDRATAHERDGAVAPQ
jgi:PAS domain S-box-containing protein